MTLMPNETVTTLPAVEKARGKVVTFGLGLGYFTYMASLKDEVESVTVVELSPDVISLFEEHILPQFEKRDKIKIICADAFDFAENTMKQGDFDFVFADFWHDVGDGRELYLKMKEYENKFRDTEFTYWLEDTIKCYLDRDLWP
jgi:spermidine synthase